MPGSQQEIHFLGDGIGLNPQEYSTLLASLVADGRVTSDAYSQGGVVRDLENHFAHILGKESAVFLPTGVLANSIAIRRLAAGTSRVLVAADSHLYSDSYDCIQLLSHLNLVPLAAGSVGFRCEDVIQACADAARYPFSVDVGVISVESPVRRHANRMVAFEEMRKISYFARSRGIRLHLDGARLLVASACTSIAPADYADLFDTVYVSLYKGLNAAGGAILAGPTSLMQHVKRDQKVFGCGLYQSWPYAAVALHYLPSFIERLRLAKEQADALFAQLSCKVEFRVELPPDGTNVYRLHLAGIDPMRYADNLSRQGILVREPDEEADFHGLTLVVNETILRTSVDTLTSHFYDAASR